MTAIEDYARRAVPRYTSYPTVPQFRQPFPEATYREWLAELNRCEPLSIYPHVPFCRQMCWYCGCNMKLVARYARGRWPRADFRSARASRSTTGLAGMAVDGLLTIDGARLRLTEAGGPLTRVVASVFDAYLGRATARHSAAI